MNEAIIIKTIFIFMAFWLIGVVLLWFRPRLEVFWKIIATLLFGFYLWFFFDEIHSGFLSFKGTWLSFSLHFLKELLTLVFVNLFFLWPLSLILIFYKADDLGAERLLKFMSILTLVLWIIFIVYFFYSRGIDTFFYKNLKQILPNVK